MEQLMSRMNDRIESLYSINPPGPLMELASISKDHVLLMNDMYGDKAAAKGSPENLGLVSRVDQLFTERTKIIGGITGLGGLIATSIAVNIHDFLKMLHLGG